MIVKMSKVYVASMHKDTRELLDALADLGVMHIQAVQKENAVADEQTLNAINELQHAVLIVSTVEKTGDVPQNIDPLQAARQTTSIHRHIVDLDNKLTGIYKKLEAEAIWGDTRNEQFKQLEEMGIDLRFFFVLPEQVRQIKADCVCPLKLMQGKHQLVAAGLRNVELKIPDDAHEVQRPVHDRPELKKQSQEINEHLKSYSKKLKDLANLSDEMKTALAQYRQKAMFASAENGGFRDDELFAIQGWVPSNCVETLGDKLKGFGMDAAVKVLEPADDEEPPTLIQYPRWAKPIKTLFDILGTTPGYREYDLSPFFMVAMPIFAAMLIGDAGYGLIFTLVALLGFKKITAKAGKGAAQLLTIFGLVMLGWGLITANFFGITPDNLASWPNLCEAMKRAGILWNANPEVSRNTIMQISFVFGTIHLMVAHIRQMIAFAPNIKCLSEIGWVGFLFGMLGVVWMLFFPNEIWMPASVLGYCLIIGGSLIILFSFPSRNIIKMILMGLVGNLLGFLGSFSDTMSYIRLMAVGLASYYIASAFNTLGYDVASSSALFIPAGALIIIFAHALNIFLGIIAIFAHGVRLNMLEFSNNAGVQWAGYAFNPFARTTVDHRE